MNLLGELRVLSMPRWLKAGLAVLLLTVLVGGVVLVVLGAAADEPEWVDAGGTAVVASLPIVVIGAVLLFGTTGPSALEERTERVLTETLPSTLKRLPSLMRRPGAEATVVAMPEGSGFSASYEVRLSGGQMPGIRLRFRVELNVKKANFSLALSKQRFGPKGAESLSDAFTNAFPSTLAGAATEGYTFAGTSFVNQDDRLSFVLVRQLPAGFLYDSGEQLYFSQDLAMMLGSFVGEQPGLFTEPSSA